MLSLSINNRVCSFAFDLLVERLINTPLELRRKRSQQAKKRFGKLYNK